MSLDNSYTQDKPLDITNELSTTSNEETAKLFTPYGSVKQNNTSADLVTQGQTDTAGQALFNNSLDMTKPWTLSGKVSISNPTTPDYASWGKGY